MTETTRALDARDTRSHVRDVVREHVWTIAIWLAMAGWSASIFLLVRRAYLSFELARFDLGNMVQAVWNTTQLRPLEFTTAAGDQMARLGSHVDPILVLLTPFWLAFPSPLTLAAVQIVAVALGALPVFWLARRHLGSEKAAGLLGLAYLASPWLAWTAHDAIHPKTFAIPLFLYAVWFLDSERLRPFAVFAVLAAASGELMGLSIAALGIWYAVARGRKASGTAIAVLGVGWSFVALYVVVPAFSGGPSDYLGLYEKVGGSPSGIVRTAVTDPGTILAALSGRHELLYLFLLAVPLLGSFLLAPWLAGVALPQFLLNALADADGPSDPRHHYIAGIIPFLFAAAAIGLARVAPARRVVAAGAILFTSLTLSVLLGPWPGIERVPIRYELDVSPAHVDVLRRALALVPEDASVSATNKVGAHLSARRYFYSVPIVPPNAEWVVLDTYDVWMSYKGYPFLVDRPRSELLALRNDLAADDKWKGVFAEDGMYVFRRVGR